MWNSLTQDLRYAFRSARRDAGFFAFAVLILGVGIGANTAIFSIINPLLLRPLPFEAPERLVWIANSGEGGRSAVTSRTSNLRDFRTMSTSFEALTGYDAFFDYEGFNLVGDGEPERLVGVGVARNFLEVLGIERRCCTARSKSLTSLCRSQSHPAQYVSGIPSPVILLSISHPIRCSTRCLANVRVRISGPMIAL